MEYLTPGAAVENEEPDGVSVRYTPAVIFAAGDTISLQLTGHAQDGSFAWGQGRIIHVPRQHIRPALVDAACGPVQAGDSLDAWNGCSWVRVQLTSSPVTIEGEAYVVVVYEADQRMGPVKVKLLRRGYDYTAGGPEPGWKARSPCIICTAIRKQLLSRNAIIYHGVESLHTDWVVCVRNKSMRLFMRSPHMAVAAMWADALRDYYSDFTSPRNFTEDTRKLVLPCLGLPSDLSFDVGEAMMRLRGMPEPMAPAPNSTSAAFPQAGAASGQLEKQQSAGSKRRWDANAGDSNEAARASWQRLSASNGSGLAHSSGAEQGPGRGATSPGSPNRTSTSLQLRHPSSTGSGAAAAAAAESERGLKLRRVSVAAQPHSRQDMAEADMSARMASLSADEWPSTHSGTQHAASQPEVGRRQLPFQGSQSGAAAAGGLARAAGSAATHPLYSQHGGARAAGASTWSAGGVSVGSEGGPVAPGLSLEATLRKLVKQERAWVAAVAHAAANGNVSSRHSDGRAATEPAAAGCSSQHAAAGDGRGLLLKAAGSGLPAAAQNTTSAANTPPSLSSRGGALSRPSRSPAAAGIGGSSPAIHMPNPVCCAASAAAGTAWSAGGVSGGGVGRPEGFTRPPVVQGGGTGAAGAGVGAAGGCSSSSSSKHSHGTPAAPPTALLHGSQHVAAAAAAGTASAQAAAGGGQPAVARPSGGEQHAAAQSSGMAAGMPPALPSRGLQLSEPAAATAAQGVGRVIQPPPSSKPLAAPAAQPHDQAAVQQLQLQQAAAAPAAVAPGKSAGVGRPAKHLLLGLADVSDVVPMFLPGATSSTGTEVPLKVHGKMGKGGQAGVLLVEMLEQRGWHQCLPRNTEDGAPPFNWSELPAVPATSSSSSAAAGTGAAAAAAAAAAGAKHAPVMRALKVGLPLARMPWESMEDWVKARNEHLEHTNRSLWREHTLLTRAHQPAHQPPRANPHVLKSYHFGAVTLPGCDYPLPGMLLEYCPGGSLDKHLSESTGGGKPPTPGLSYTTARSHMRAVCAGVSQLHLRHIAHRDLKSCNILVAWNEGKPFLKVADLGHALDFSSGLPSKTQAYTRYFCPPEMKPETYHDVRLDTWLIGCLLLELRTGQLPFHFLPEDSERRSADELDNPASPYYNLGLEEDEKELLRTCLVRDQSKRPPLQEVMMMDEHKDYFAT